MSSTKEFSDVVHEWSEIFMHRSFHDFKQFMNEHDLSASQTGTLMRLYHRGTCGVSDIGESVGITNAAASQMIERMVQQGWVERSECPDDRRAKLLALSPKGRALIEEGIEARWSWMEKLAETLTPEQQTTIAEALKMLTAAVRQQEGDG